MKDLEKLFKALNDVKGFIAANTLIMNYMLTEVVIGECEQTRNLKSQARKLINKMIKDKDLKKLYLECIDMI